jgi:hypothetical protein
MAGSYPGFSAHEQMLGEGAAPGEVEQFRHTLGLISRFMCSTAIISGNSRTAISGQSFKFQAPVRGVVFF